MQRAPSVSSASSSAYDSSVCHTSPVTSPRVFDQEPSYDHTTIALNRLSMKLGHIQPGHRPRPSLLAQEHASKVTRHRTPEKRTISCRGSSKGAKKELKNATKAGVEKVRRDASSVILGRMQRVISSNNTHLQQTAMQREFRPEGGMRGLGRNNINHPHAATFDKKDVMELTVIQLEQDNAIIGDVLQELEEHVHNDHLWFSDMQALVRSGASHEALSKCLNGRPIITDLLTRARYSLARRAGQDFQSPAQLKQ
ncbi:hypothetical protein P3342_009184 [Pyrenophora teres f. teres]|nr:hypothetical protein P3342_009184 [Pyrenophora teres f. teres]